MDHFSLRIRKRLLLHVEISTWWSLASMKERNSVVLTAQILGDEFPQTFQVLAIQFDVVVTGTLHPEGLHGLRAALVEG